jgi:NitT/TauT family transport system ATP-binding protein
LELREVTKRYKRQGGGFQVALDRLNFGLDEGEFVVVVGPSGAGKTTLLNVVAGFIKPDSGRLVFDGKPLAGPGPDRAVVFQDSALFPWLTVEGNVAFGLRMQHLPKAEREAIVQEKLELVGLTEWAKAYPHELSGGMKQRVAVARALALRPRLLLMDEPFGALDTQMREHLQDELLRLWQAEGCAVLLVTHNLEEALYLADRVALLAKGGRLQQVMAVNLPRPRERLAGPLCVLKRQLRDFFGESELQDDGCCCTFPQPSEVLFNAE